MKATEHYGAGEAQTETAEAIPAPGMASRWDPSAWEVDTSQLRNLPFYHPMECEPRRSQRGPKWLPPQRANHPHPRSSPPDWGKPRIVAAPDVGAVRVGMTWRQFFVTSAAFSRKAGRTMFFEGPHEAASFRRLEISFRTTDLQFQPLLIEWVRDGRVEHQYYVDSVEERDSGLLVFRENKAHRAYFDDPLIDEKLSAAEAVLTSFPDVQFERELGADLMHPLRWRLAKDIYDDRRIAFTARQREDVRDLLTREGGSVPLGKVWEAIGGRPGDAERIANAMMIARLVGYRFDRKPHRDTQAILPRPPAQPGRLRRFLASFARKTDA